MGARKSSRRNKNMSDMSPTMLVYAGNNGSGKSTIRSLIMDRIGIPVNIDPDAMARRLNPQHPESARVSAGKEAIRLARECIRAGREFTVETTLSGNYAIRLMQEAKESGFHIAMFYVGLGDPRLNMERVAGRVLNGGHHISSQDIMNRHHSSVENLLRHLDWIGRLTVIDNSGLQGEIVLEAAAGKLIDQAERVPSWVVPIYKRLIPS